MILPVTELPWKNMRARVHAPLATQAIPAPNASGLEGSTGEERESSRSPAPNVCVCVMLLFNNYLVYFH